MAASSGQVRGNKTSHGRGMEGTQARIRRVCSAAWNTSSILYGSNGKWLSSLALSREQMLDARLGLKPARKWHTCSSTPMQRIVMRLYEMMQNW